MEKHIKSADFIVKLFYTRFKIFNIKLGIYPILGLIPGLGDIISITLAAYLLWIASKLDLPFSRKMHIVANSFIDLIVGSIPVLGDFADTIYQAHNRNLKIIKKHASSL